MSIRDIVPLYWLLTQTSSSSTTREEGPSLTSIRCTRPVLGVTRETDWPNSLATHTSFAVTARATGPASTLTSTPTRWPVRLSSGVSVPARPFAIHSVESKTARASGPSPTVIGGSAFSVAGSTCWTVLSPLCDPDPVRAGDHRRRFDAHGDRLGDDPGRGVDPGEDLLVEPGHPEVVPTRGDRLR